MGDIPAHLKYTAEHEWVEVLNADRVRVGITDFAQHALGDIVFVLTPKVGDNVNAGSVCGEVESTKSVSEIYAPVSGRIAAINPDVTSRPETINGSPYTDGWLFEIEGVGANALDSLLDSAAYSAITGD